MWEVFTTKPWFDSKELQYLGEVPTPWPAFVFVSQASEDSDDGDVHEIGASVSEHRLSQDKARLIRDRLFPALHKGVAIFQAEAQESNAVDGKGMYRTILFLSLIHSPQVTLILGIQPRPAFSASSMSLDTLQKMPGLGSASASMPRMDECAWTLLS